jgi:polar amino acid transport system ATP-binding protein
LEIPTGGQIVFNGADITAPKTNINKHRQKMGMVFQHFNLFPNMTVLGNMTSAPINILKKSKQEAEAKALELLNRVGLKDKANSYPSQLSGGQKQRVAIARALASNPEYLLCDEPTSALDPEATESILQILKQINREQGITVIIITHELGVITKLCNKVVVIEKGNICEHGKVSEVFNNPKTEQTKRLISAFTIEIPKKEEE